METTQLTLEDLLSFSDTYKALEYANTKYPKMQKALTKPFFKTQS